MLHSRPHIEAGDLVIMYFTRESMQPITVTPGEYFHNKFGRYAHTDMVGMKFGSKMHAPKPHSGYIYLLRPTPELWTLSLPHRTQILYQTDISYIIQRLGVRPGTRVVEAGTGSGSMTHSLSRAVGPRGNVFSFEYHQNRFEAAKAEFESHNLANVRINHRNVCKDGFGEAENVQAIFLDLPAPWEAISDAIKAFDPTKIARICCFSPCLEQVLKTVTTLREQQFEDISTVEVLTRTHELVPPAPANTPARLRDITSIVTGLKEHEDKKNQRRIIQMKAAREKAREKKEAAASKAATAVPEPALDSEPSATGETSKDPEAKGDLTSPSALKRKHEELEVEAEITGSSAEGDPSKKPKTEGDDAVEGDIDQGAEDRVDKSTARIWTEPTTNIQNVIITKPSYEMRGHTSYLTFALYYPASIRQQLDSQDVAPTPGGSTPVPKRLEEVAVESREDRSGSQETEYGDKAMEEVMGTMTEEDMMALGA